MNLYFSIDYKDGNMQRLKWLTDNYSDKNIANVTKIKICSFLASIQFTKLENIEKAISQDIKKMLLTAKKIHDYSLEFQKTPLFVENENGEAELFYDEKRDSLQINMEYYIYKYRVIIEYIIRILDLVVDMDEKKYKQLKNIKNISSFERQNIKLEYIEKLIEIDKNGALDVNWFNEIRKVRNRLVHDGASCFIFENEDEPLFQVYTLEVDNLLDVSSFLTNGNAISCKYFIAVTTAQLIYFLETTFQVLKNRDKNQNFDYLCCKLNYKISSNNTEKGLAYFDQLYGISRDIPIYQKSLFTMVQQYLRM